MKEKIYLVNENLDEFAKRGRPPKKRAADTEDDWYSAEDEFDAPEVGPEQIEDIEIEDEVTDLSVQRQLKKMVKNELGFSEPNRGVLSIVQRSSGQRIEGKPLALLSGGEAVLLSTKTGPKKVRFDDMIMESYEKKDSKYVSESFRDYE